MSFLDAIPRFMIAAITHTDPAARFQLVAIPALLDAGAGRKLTVAAALRPREIETEGRPVTVQAADRPLVLETDEDIQNRRR